MKEEPCISIYALSFHFRPVLALPVSYTFLSLAYVYPSFFRVHAALIAKVYLCPQSCLWSVAAELPEKAAVLFFSSLQENTLSKENQQLAKKSHIALAAGKFKGLLGLLFVLDYCSSQKLPFLSVFVCFFSVSMKVYAKTRPF